MAQKLALPLALPVEDAVRYLRAISRLMTADATVADNQVERALEAALLSGTLADPDHSSLCKLYPYLRVCLQALPPPPENGGQPAAVCLPFDAREVVILQRGAGFSVKEISRLLGQRPDRVSRKLREAEDLLCKPCRDAFAPPRAA